MHFKAHIYYLTQFIVLSLFSLCSKSNCNNEIYLTNFLLIYLLLFFSYTIKIAL